MESDGREEKQNFPGRNLPSTIFKHNLHILKSALLSRDSSVYSIFNTYISNSSTFDFYVLFTFALFNNLKCSLKQIQSKRQNDLIKA